MEPQTPVVSAASPTPTNTAVEAELSHWPGAFGIYKHSRDAVRRNFWTIFWLGVLYAATSVILGSVAGHNSGATYSSGLAIRNIISVLLGVVFDTAIACVVLASARGNKMRLQEAFSQSLPLYLKSLGLTILQAIIAVVTFLLLVIPFFIIVPRLALSLYFLVDQKLGPIQAIKASWKATKGNVGKVWGIYGATFLMALLIFVLVGIYFLFMYSAAVALLYVYASRPQSQPQATETPVIPSSSPQL